MLDDYDWDMMGNHNRSLFAKNVDKAALNEETGMAAFSISEEMANAIYEDVKIGFGRAVFEGYKDGQFVFVTTMGKRTHKHVITGFSTYQINHGKQDEHNGDRQMKHTTTFNCAQIKQVKTSFQSFQHVCDIVTQSFGMEIAHMDILRQSSTGIGGAQEALFGWHRDNDGNRTDARMTVIFSLTATKSSMQVLGFNEFHYDKPGCGIAFISNYWHRSIKAEPGTIKLALFLKGTSKRCETLAWKQCICKKVDPPTKKRGWLVEDWFQCNTCDRWCHGICANKHGKFVGDDFFCSLDCEK
jgi:hypothetical protein